MLIFITLFTSYNGKKCESFVPGVGQKSSPGKFGVPGRNEELLLRKDGSERPQVSILHPPEQVCSIDC